MMKIKLLPIKEVVHKVIINHSSQTERNRKRMRNGYNLE